MKINSYLTFDGHCEQAFVFYQSVFGGEFIVMSRFEQMPENEGCVISETDMNKIMHVSLAIDDESTLMGCDTIGDSASRLSVGNNFTLSVNLSNRKEAERIFNHLAKGGQPEMSMRETFWQSYFGMLTDQFGIQWMVNCDLMNSNAQ